MSARTRDVGERRAALLERSRLLRLELAADGGAIAERLRLVDRVVALGRVGWLRTALTVGTALVLSRRTRRVLGVAARVLALYPALGPLVRRLWPRRSLVDQRE